jgi:hypothetical protein
MDQMRMDPKHQFAAQYVLQRAASERREREALLAAAMSAGMSAWGMGGMGGMSGMGGMGMTGSPIHSDTSTRISTPQELKMENGGPPSLRSPLGAAAAAHHQANMEYCGLSRMSFSGFHHSMQNHPRYGGTVLEPQVQERAGSTGSVWNPR